MSERAAQLIFELHKGQSQFAYFQLGVAASAIAFAIHRTTGVSLADAPWPIGLAVLLWALSFALGCFGLDARQTGLLSNAAFLEAVHEVQVRMPGVDLAEITAESKKQVGRDLGRPVTRFRWQKWLLFAGAIAYICGHLMQMAAIPQNTEALQQRPASKGGLA